MIRKDKFKNSKLKRIVTSFIASAAVVLLIGSTLLVGGCANKNKNNSNDVANADNSVNTTVEDNASIEESTTEVEPETYTLEDGEVIKPQVDKNGEVVTNPDGDVTFVNENGETVAEKEIPSDVKNTAKENATKPANNNKNDNSNKVADNDKESTASKPANSNSGSSSNSGSTTTKPSNSNSGSTTTKPSTSNSGGTTTKPAATKPAATKPAATKPAETKPAATKPAATKPAADNSKKAYTTTVENMMFRVDPAKKVATYVKYDDLPEAEIEEICQKLKNVKMLNIPETVDGYRIDWGTRDTGSGIWQFYYCKDMTINIPGSWTQQMIYDADISAAGGINAFSSNTNKNKIIWNTTNAADVSLEGSTWNGQKKSVLYLPNISAKDVTVRDNEGKKYKCSDAIDIFNSGDGRFVVLASMKIVFKDATFDRSKCQ